MVPNYNTQPIESRVILIGFDNDRVKTILADESVTKLIIFDDDETNEVRCEFEKIYQNYRGRITLYEGLVESNLDRYFKLRGEEGITPEIHRFEVRDNTFKIFNI
jgi:hypothetical protein